MFLVGACDFLGTASSHGGMFQVGTCNFYCAAPSLLGCFKSARTISSTCTALSYGGILPLHVHFLVTVLSYGGMFRVSACDFLGTASSHGEVYIGGEAQFARPNRRSH